MSNGYDFFIEYSSEYKVLEMVRRIGDSLKIVSVDVDIKDGKERSQFSEISKANDYIESNLDVLELVVLDLKTEKTRGGFIDYSLWLYPDSTHIQLSIEDSYVNDKFDSFVNELKKICGLLNVVKIYNGDGDESFEWNKNNNHTKLSISSGSNEGVYDLNEIVGNNSHGDSD